MGLNIKIATELGPGKSFH